MARIQILELPEGAGDDRPPFVLVFDEWTSGEYVPYGNIAQQTGARGVVRLRVEPDLTGFREQVMVEVAQAQADARAALQ